MGVAIRLFRESRSFGDWIVVPGDTMPPSRDSHEVMRGIATSYPVEYPFRFVSKTTSSIVVSQSDGVRLPCRIWTGTAAINGQPFISIAGRRYSGRHVALAIALQLPVEFFTSTAWTVECAWVECLEVTHIIPHDGTMKAKLRSHPAAISRREGRKRKYTEDIPAHLKIETGEEILQNLNDLDFTSQHIAEDRPRSKIQEKIAKAPSVHDIMGILKEEK